MKISLYGRVENIVGIGENAGYQHFLLFTECFQKASSIGLLKSGFCPKEVITLRDKTFESIVGKGENVCNQHFSFSQSIF